MGALRKSQAIVGAGSEESRAFLGVEASSRGFRWCEFLKPSAGKDALAISQKAGLPDVLGRVLAARGVRLDDVSDFLDPTLRNLMPDPSSLAGMDTAAQRIADAVLRGEKVAVFGDYDVDGACSSALMARFFAHHGIEARIYIPDRLNEGYGPNANALDDLITNGASLIVTVDCGTTSVDVLGGVKDRADVVVIDHHQADEVIPDVTALVNPNREDDMSGLGHLCAAGVVFLVLVAVARLLRQAGHYAGELKEMPLMSELELVALATVADVVPLQGLNRAFVTQGLKVMHHRNNVGLRALADAAGLSEKATPYHLGYILGPRINAGGRIGDSGLGAKLLSVSDPSEASRIAAILDRLNKERKTIEQQALEEATAAADQLMENAPDTPVIIVGSEDWHKGVVGLIASRLTDRFKRPSCVISWDGAGAGGVARGTGSLRSVAAVDIGRVVRGAAGAGLLLKGGGHAMAAGLTIARDQLDALKAYFAKELADAREQLQAPAELLVDGALTPEAVTNEFLDLLEQAGPYGQGHPQPRFVFPSHRVKFARVVGDAHVRCVLEAGDGSRLDAIAFRAVGHPHGDLLLDRSGLPLHVAGQLRRDSWGGRVRLELAIDDVAKPSAGRA